ncbi:MAG: hypothetical protein GC180_08700 [Bacteroidetes bacterium]|nr:hypothetical protein [Bacteroidota bacterium]
MSQIIAPISEALQAMIAGFTEGNPEVNAEEGQNVLSSLVTLMGHSSEFPSKLKELDAIFDAHPAFEPLYHYLFDLLMLSFIASDANAMDEQYLESEEWLKIEEETSDQGSELLNLYIYLQEAVAEEVRVNLDDYLREFLLADDDLYQDDFFIYEEILKKEDMEEAGIEDILDMARHSESPELEEVMVPMLAFFCRQDSRETIEQALKNDGSKGLHLALYKTIHGFYHGLKES